MNILLVHPSFYVYGGAELVIVELVKHLQKKHSVSVLTTMMIPEVKDDLHVEVIFSKNLYRTFQDIYKNFDVVNFHNHPVELFLKEKYPSIWQCNEPPDIVLDGGILPEEEKRQIVSNISRFVVADRKNAERFRRVYGVDPDIVPYGVDFEFWNSGAGDRFYWNTEDTFALLHVGMIHPRKNQLRSCEVVKNLKDKIPNIKLILAGLPVHSEYFMNILKYIEEHDLKNNFSYAGNIDRELLGELYHSVDVLIHPIGSQGGWLTPIEALCSDLYPVVSPEACVSSLFEDNQIDVVTERYEERILDFYEDRKKYLPIIEKGKQFIKRNLSWNNYSSKIETILEEVSKK